MKKGHGISEELLCVLDQPMIVYLEAMKCFLIRKDHLVRSLTHTCTVIRQVCIDYVLNTKDCAMS